MRFDRLDLNLLVALDVLLEEKSVTRSADRLCLSQSAMSGALNRLREYFDDQILQLNGRKMVLTPKAEELVEPVRHALSYIKTNIMTPAVFDPATSDRKFTIMASDFIFSILVSHLLRDARKLAPNLTFEIQSMGMGADYALRKGDVDIVITLDINLTSELIKKPLFTDHFVVVCCSSGKYKNGITEKQYKSARHVLTHFGPDKFPAFADSHLEAQGFERHVDVSVPSFSLIAESVIGTDRVGLLHSRFAKELSNYYPIAIHPCPVDIPDITEIAMWNPIKDSDEGVVWLYGLIKDIVEKHVSDQPVASSLSSS